MTDLLAGNAPIVVLAAVALQSILVIGVLVKMVRADRDRDPREDRQRRIDANATERTAHQVQLAAHEVEITHLRERLHDHTTLVGTIRTTQAVVEANIRHLAEAVAAIGRWQETHTLKLDKLLERVVPLRP